MTHPDTPIARNARPRVAYLLADAGIPLADSKKGPSIHARSMIRAFVREGCAVDVYVMRRGKGPLPDEADVHVVRRRRLTRWWKDRWLQNGRWKCLPGLGARTSPPNWMTAVDWRLWHRDFFRDAAAGCAARRPDLIYARDAWLAWPYAALRRRLNVPLFLEVNAVLSLEKETYGEAAFIPLARRIEREMFLASDRVLPVSDALVEPIVRLGGDPSRVVVTPNAVDAELFSPPANGPERPEGTFVVGAVNSMRAYHGMGTLLRAAARLRGEIAGLRLLLIGDGAQREPMRALAAELGIADRVEFTGVVAHEEVARRLRACDVCASPNEGDLNQYNCPMKLYEYMSMKIPVVASRWGEIPRIVEDGVTGLLHAPGDPDSLAAALRAVWSDPRAARARAQTAWSRVQSKTWRAIARRVLDWAGVAERAIARPVADAATDPAETHRDLADHAR
jgi:glycosyltransferase involved in cell wall biosynthesis